MKERQKLRNAGKSFSRILLTLLFFTLCYFTFVQATTETYYDSTNNTTDISIYKAFPDAIFVRERPVFQIGGDILGTLRTYKIDEGGEPTDCGGLLFCGEAYFSVLVSSNTSQSLWIMSTIGAPVGFLEDTPLAYSPEHQQWLYLDLEGQLLRDVLTGDLFVASDFLRAGAPLKDSSDLAIDSSIIIASNEGSLIHVPNITEPNRSSIPITSGVINDKTVSFIHPLEKPSPPAGTCYVGGECIYGPNNLHVGRDYGVGSDRNTPAYSVNFGMLRQAIDFNQKLGCTHLSCSMGNTVVIEHLLTTGDKWLSLYAHLASKNLNGFPIYSRIAKKQKIGIVGCSGSAIESWCNSEGGNRHTHLELKWLGLGTSNLYPYGYMNQSEADSSATKFDFGSNLAISQVINRLFSDIDTFQNNNKKTLIPYVSYLNKNPSSTTYDVYGISGRRLYASMTVRPTQPTAFKKVGIGGRDVNDQIRNIFIRDTLNLNENSEPLCGNRTFQCADPEGCDYTFFAYIAQRFDGQRWVNVGSGYPLKVSILPSVGSEIIDNDGRYVDTSGYKDQYRAAYYAANEGGSLNVPGYYLSARLFKSGSAQWARWFPSSNGTYKIYAHIPPGSTATNVRYNVYCNAKNKCGTSDQMDQSSNNNKWVQITLNNDPNTTFEIQSKGFIGVTASSVTTTGQLIGVDAVKFIRISTVLPTITVAATDSSASEPGTDTGTFTVTREGGSTSSALTVNFSVGGTATSGADYDALPNSVTIPAGQLSATIPVTPKDDADPESDETVIVTIANNASYTVGNPGSATVTIKDNDSPITLSVSPTSGSQGTPFSYTGSNYTKNGTVEWHVKKPDGSEYDPVVLSGKVDGSGNFSHSYTSSCSNAVGDYTIWAKDLGTGRESSKIPQTITANQSCNPITLSVSPTSGSQGTPFSYTGSNYTKNGTVEWHVKKPDGSEYDPVVLSGKVDGSGNFSHSYTSSCSNAVGDYTIWAKDLGTGRESSKIPQTITANQSCNPITLSVSPTSGSQGTPFSYTGSNYTKNGTVEWHVKKPDGSEYDPVVLSGKVDGSGNFSHSYTSSCSNAVGDYTIWAKDLGTGRESSKIPQTITANQSCNPITLSVSPTSGSQGTPFSYTGSNYTKNGTVEWHVKKPDGSEYDPVVLSGKVDGSGNFSHSYTSSCSNAVGDYTIWAKDLGTGRESSKIPQTITANQSCNPITLSVSPTSGSQGTPFSYTGSNYTKNGTVEWHVKKPDGSEYDPVVLSGKVDGSGNFSHSYTSSCSNAVGDYTIWAKDLGTGRESSKIPQTITANQSCGVNPTVTVNPTVGQRGTSFSQPGSSFTPNSTATLHFKKPDGTETSTVSKLTDANGAYTHSWPTNADTPVGTYEYWASDDTSNKKSNVFSFMVTMKAANIPDTGQTKCYGNSGETSCPNPGQSFYGQDGNYQGAQPAYLDNGDGTVTDLNTGLMWQQGDDHNGAKQNHQEALDYCGGLDLAGQSDWRLPTLWELRTLIIWGKYNPAIDTANFPGCLAEGYWTSSDWSLWPVRAWFIGFDVGLGSHLEKSGGNYVRCVRGETNLAAFMDNQDGTVSDTGAGLIWQQSDDGVLRTWQDALTYCEGLSLAGQDDWRLPNIRELGTLMKADTWENPTIDPVFKCQSDAYWSSTTYAYSPDFAWYQNFYQGNLDRSTKSASRLVLCVHGGP